MLFDFYSKTRSYSEEICKPLKIEDYIPQPTFFISPPKWNLAHTTWFFEEMILKQYLPGYKQFHPRFNFLFNSYYNSLGERTTRQSRGDLSRPTVEEVYQYRHYIDKHMQILLKSDKLDSILENLVLLGINHEQQHQELFFTDLKYTFSLNPLLPAYNENALCEDGEDTYKEFVSVESNIYEIGYQGEGFCYDNELAHHKVYLQPYEIRKDLVRNGEFLEFIENNGYHRFEFWHEEALNWLKENKITKPWYWFQQDGQWFQYTLAGPKKLNPDHILTHISYYEAAAFAQWKSCRLPTEFEWEAASDQFDWGKRWEWTESAYLPYPGYKKDKGAVGEYNGKFMVNQKVLRGSSVATSENHSRKTYRNFFHPNMGWQFNGIRLAK
ncbi:MAG: ergothioneine biosynthesis protein EgtB [Bacteroidales bacterium]|nr:ergothioneine biosynthesis protein EgtB [Bacteroidales bacterium]MCF8402569.1 ergothioneine biosynthesis protein EgtB [Bacteroidales bacterium]